MALNSELPAGGERAPVFEHAPSSPTNHVFRLIDFDIDNFTLKMTFNHQNNIRNGLFSQNHIKHILHFLLFVFVKNHIFYTFDLGIDFLTSKLSLNMTFHHQNNTINGFSSQKAHRKEVLHLFVVLYATNHIFQLLDLEIDFLALKMTFDHQNKTRNGLINQKHIKHKYYTSCYLCLLKIILFIPLTLELTF